MTMRAAVFRGPGELHVEERPVPTVGAGEVLLRVRACAVCGSDLRTLRHGHSRVAPPRVLGHEIAGEVAAVGEGVTSLSVGDRVSTGADAPCGACSACRSGAPNHCATNLAIGYQWDGGFADYVVLDQRMVDGGPVATFDASLPFVDAALAEPVACCLNGWERLPASARGHVVILGAGPIGLMLAMVGRALGRLDTVTFVDPLAPRRATAAPFADHVVDVPDALDAVLDHTGGRGADVVFTANSAPSSHPLAVDLVAIGGAINLFGGLPKGTGPVAIDTNRLHYREAILTGSHGSTPDQHARALALIADGTVGAGAVVSETVAVDGLPDAARRAMTGEALKVVMTAGDAP